MNEVNLHVEHEFASVREKIGNLIGKLEKREDNSEKRIENLEAVVKTEVEGTLAGRLDHLEKQMKGNVESKINGLNKQLDAKISRMEELLKKSEATAKGATAADNNKPSSWPFYFLVLIVFSQVAVTVWIYLKLQKMHLL